MTAGPASFGRRDHPARGRPPRHPAVRRAAGGIHRQARAAFTIGVYGAWGSGKTTFVRLMEGELRERHPDKLKFIGFEAWPFKTSDDLWRALVQKIAYAMHEVKEPEQTPSANGEPPGRIVTTRLGRRLREPAFRFQPEPAKPRAFASTTTFCNGSTTRVTAACATPHPEACSTKKERSLRWCRERLRRSGICRPLVSAMRGFFGLDSKVDVAKLLQQEKNETTRNRIKSVEDFRKAVAELFENPAKDQKVCVFIDDLDRCMPDVALDLLEALKIFLGETRCIFIVAADEQLIGEGLRIRYKELLAIPRADEDPQLFPRKGKEYFEKIIQLGIRVPDHAAPHVHRFIAAQFPQWLASTDLIQSAVGSNPRRLKQYCTWLDYKYTVVRDPKSTDDFPLLTKLVELWSRDAVALHLLQQLALDPNFPELMTSIEKGSRDELVNSTAIELSDLVAQNRAVRRVLDRAGRCSPRAIRPRSPPSLYSADVIPDAESTRMLKSEDGVLIRLFEKVARTGAPEEADILNDDLAKLEDLNKLDTNLAAILKELATRDDWSNVMESVESSLQGTLKVPPA